MKAIVFHAPKTVSIEEVPMPEIMGDEALVKVVQVGICGGDSHFYDGSQPYANYPQIYGHEVVGRIEKLPDGAECDFNAGELRFSALAARVIPAATASLTAVPT